MQLRWVATREGRLSSFLKGELKMSTGLMNKLKWGDAIRVNDHPEHTDYPVRLGDVITVRLDEPAPAYPAEQGELTVLLEDDHILVVDKPAGMLILLTAKIPAPWPIWWQAILPEPGRILRFIR